MKKRNEKMPNPGEIEKEIGEFLVKKFGGNVKIVSPMVLSQKLAVENAKKTPKRDKKINFNLKPEDLVSHLDQYIVKQANAKAVLSTKICTHFNRIKQAAASPDNGNELTGSIKNNILMVGPTGVGKTYMIKLIAKKIGVPFVKGDATKFSETGYVGGDVEDLIRNLVSEVDDDIKLAQYGIVYIDEIDKIAGSRNLAGADISRTGVQRALLKPMEETDVDLKVPHDPISMIQEIEHFRKTGKRNKRSVNTKNILFIMSGAFSDLPEIIRKRIKDKGIGFGANITSFKEQIDTLKHVMSEDLIEFGFESEFIGRLPIKAVFERLTEDDLFNILKNPNNSIILGKKLDFAAYGIDIKFEDKALRVLARNAFKENTGARGLVSATEKALLFFENKLPSSDIKRFSVTVSAIENPEKSFEMFAAPSNDKKLNETFEKLLCKEKEFIKEYIKSNKKKLNKKYKLNLTPSRIGMLASFYCEHMMDIENVIKKIKSYYDKIKKIELYFFKNHDINIVIEDDACDFLVEKFVSSDINLKGFYKQLTTDFENGLKLIQEKTGKNRFFITKQALIEPEFFINGLMENMNLGI